MIPLLLYSIIPIGAKPLSSKRIACRIVAKVEDTAGPPMTGFPLRSNKAAAVVVYRKALITKEMRCPRLS
jgi:hypothetical protein